MSTINQLVISGSHEAVAEVVMALRQALYLQIDRSGAQPVVMIHGVGPAGDLSQRPFKESPIQDSSTADTTMDGHEFDLRGIEDLEAYSRFTGSFTVVFDRLDDLLETLSRAHPDVVVANLGGEAEDADWRGQSWSAGRVTTFRLPVPPDLDERAMLPPGHLDVIEKLALTSLQQARAARTTSSHGWPRWSLLAHAANAQGVTGLARAMAAAGGGAGDMAAALRAENEQARRLGVASWVDTLMFGEPAPRAAEPGAVKPYTSVNVDVWAPRQQELLGFIADNQAPQAPHHDVAAALVQALGDPDTRLQHGLHPVAFLPTARIEALASSLHAKELSPALEAIFGAFVAKTGAQSLPARDPKLLASTMTAALICSSRYGSLAAAVRSGADAPMLLRSMADADEFEHTLHGLGQAYGSYADFPAPVKDEVRRLGGALEAAYTALHTHEAMQHRIESTVNGEVPVAARPRRRATV